MADMAKAGAPAKAMARRTLSLWGFFNVGFGAVIGSCWLLLVGTWMIEGGGPIPVLVAFLLGMVLMVPVGAVFGELSAAYPFRGGPVEYVARSFGERVSAVTGWAFVLGNGIIPAWDSLMLSVIVGDVLGVQPGLEWIRAVRLYSIAGFDVYLIPALVAIGAVLLVGRMNIDNAFGAARAQLVLSYIQLLGMLAVLFAAILHGDPGNAYPVFERVAPIATAAGTDALTPVGGMLAVLAVTPFFYAGFDAIPHRADEAAEGVNWNKFGKVIVMTLLASGGFYLVTTYSFGTVEPWLEFVSQPIPAFTSLAHKSPVAFAVILAVAVMCPIGPMNSFVGATSSLLASMARRGQLPASLAEVGPVTGTPTRACKIVVATALAGPFLGMGMLGPLSKVAALSLAFSYLMTSLACLRMRSIDPAKPRPFRVPAGRAGIVFAILSSAVCVGLLVWPLSPAAISLEEAALVVLWVTVGAIITRTR